MLGLLRAVNAPLPAHLLAFFTYVDQSLALVSWLSLECLYSLARFNDMAATFIVSSLLPYFWLLLLAAFWLLAACLRRKQGAWLRGRLVLAATAVWFLLYTAAAYVILSMFSCVRLDNAALAASEAQRRPLAAQGLFWTQDTSLQCFRGDHAVMAFVFGVPGLVVTLCGVPLLLLAGLARRADSLGSKQTLGAWGLLYYHYSGARAGWEGAVWLRKLGLAAAMVFLYTYGPLAQLLLFLGLLLLALAAHVAARPVPNPLLNRLELLVLGCATLTVALLLGLTVGRVAPYGAAGWALSLVIIVVDSLALLLLVGLLLWEAAYALSATPLTEILGGRDAAAAAAAAGSGARL
jgi:hypothetical protein